MNVSVSVFFDDEDIHAAYGDIEAVILRYGPEPAPHLLKQRERDLKRIGTTLAECLQVKVE
ncbi:MAG: hypothetical protein AAGL19_03385 [Pseudomonadota bacterium]